MAEHVIPDKKPSPSRPRPRSKKRLSFNEVYRYGQGTVLGTLPRKKVKGLAAVAHQTNDPLGFMDAHAAAVETLVAQSHGIPEFPFTEDLLTDVQPKYRAICPTNNEHQDVQLYRIRPKNRKDCVCHVCGTSWVQ